jgi:hypothetical protein
MGHVSIIAMTDTEGVSRDPRSAFSVAASAMAIIATWQVTYDERIFTTLET